jgi:hypothetical protein
LTDIIDPTLTPTTVHVYAALVDCWRIYGMSPSQYELQVACRCSNTSIQKSLKNLRDRGHIISPKYGVRAIRPVDMDRRVLRDPPDPFAELEEPVRYWKDAPK